MSHHRATELFHPRGRSYGNTDPTVLPNVIEISRHEPSSRRTEPILSIIRAVRSINPGVITDYTPQTRITDPHVYARSRVYSPSIHSGLITFRCTHRVSTQTFQLQAHSQSVRLSLPLTGALTECPPRCAHRASTYNFLTGALTECPPLLVRSQRRSSRNPE